MKKLWPGLFAGKPDPDYRPEADFLPPGTILDQYIIERALAGGGFGAVYLARQRADQTQVAIKEYLPRRFAHRDARNHVVPDAGEARRNFFRGRQLFLDEARVLVRLKHRNIVEVLNFFRANATVYLVMSYEYGKILSDHLPRDGRRGLSEGFIYSVFPALLDGLCLVHQNGLLHLDIKPHNILIRSGGEPLLLDFGACQPYPYAEPAPRGKVLSRSFSAPERYDAEGQLGPWTDLYSVGATLRMCLDGTPPPDAPERLRQDSLVPAARAFRRKYSPRLLEAVDWAMTLIPAARPQSVEAFLKALPADGTASF